MNKNQRAVWGRLVKKRGRDGKEVPLSTADNFLMILRNDERFADVRFNILRGYPESVHANKARQWTDADDAASRTYIESAYGISSRPKYEDALLCLLQERRFNPLRERLESLSWDGKDRCASFFVRWMGAEDTTYSHEVSRLFFAGGIARAFDPGCKFDFVLTLIGSQGGGKSTIASWLALDPSFYTSAKTISGQKGLEAIQGKWIVEIEELLAVLANERQGQKVEESAKAFLSTQSDFYRKPYDRRPMDNPRSCIFIGTTNRQEFLTDKTGNRRWFPLRCNADARSLYAHERDVKADIEQCWAEMLAKHRACDPFASVVPRDDVLGQIREAQTDAEVEDWRVGIIERYVRDKSRVCCLQLWKEALNASSLNPPAMSRRDSLDIAEILVHGLGWLRGGTEVFREYGRQKAFSRPE